MARRDDTDGTGERGWRARRAAAKEARAQADLQARIARANRRLAQVSEVDRTAGADPGEAGRHGGASGLTRTGQRPGGATR